MGAARSAVTAVFGSWACCVGPGICAGEGVDLRSCDSVDRHALRGGRLRLASLSQPAAPNCQDLCRKSRTPDSANASPPGPAPGGRSDLKSQAPSLQKWERRVGRPTPGIQGPGQGPAAPVSPAPPSGPDDPWLGPWRALQPVSPVQPPTGEPAVVHPTSGQLHLFVHPVASTPGGLLDGTGPRPARSRARRPPWLVPSVPCLADRSTLRNGRPTVPGSICRCIATGEMMPLLRLSWHAWLLAPRVLASPRPHHAPFHPPPPLPPRPQTLGPPRQEREAERVREKTSRSLTGSIVHIVPHPLRLRFPVSRSLSLEISPFFWFTSHVSGGHLESLPYLRSGLTSIPRRPTHHGLRPRTTLASRIRPRSRRPKTPARHRYPCSFVLILPKTPRETTQDRHPTPDGFLARRVRAHLTPLATQTDLGSVRLASARRIDTRRRLRSWISRERV